MGELYFKFGILDKCFKNWIKYIENCTKSFNKSLKKTTRVREFISKYFVLVNSLNQFKKNIFIFKNYCIPDEENNYALYRKKNKFDENYELKSDLKNFLMDFEKIQNFRPNIEKNFVQFYEYYRGLIHFYIDSKFLIIFIRKFFTFFEYFRKHYK